jgi:hypothetical protein
MRVKTEIQYLEPIIESAITQSDMEGSQMFGRNKKHQQFVFLVMAHGSIRPNLFKINTRDTRYYDFGTEMHILSNEGNYSNFAKNTASNAVQFIKQNRGIPSYDGIHKFAKIVDESVPEAYVFDRDLHMFPFVTSESDVIEHKRLQGNDPYVFSVGVYEVNPAIHQNILFNNLSQYHDLSVQAKDGLIKMANELNILYAIQYKKIVTISYITSLIAYILLPIPKAVQVGVICITLYKFFFKRYVTSNAFKELTKNSVIPIEKEHYTMSEIMSELRKIPKYKKGIHHIIVSSCFGSLTDSQQIEQVLKIQDNESKMNVDVHKSFYIDAKKIYDLSSDNQHLFPDSAIYKLLEMIEVKKSNIETDTPTQHHPPFYKRVLCFLKPKKCVLYQNNVSVDTIVAICNITKLWLQILEHDPNYLDKKHKNYVKAYNAKYMCSHAIDRSQIDKILREPVSTPVVIKTDDPESFLEQFKTSQPEYLRKLIETNIKRCIFFNGSFDREMYNLLNYDVFLDFALHIEIWHDWNEYNRIFSREYAKLTSSELTKIVEKLGTDENKETLQTMSSPEYIDVDAKTFVENEIEIGNVSETQYEKEYMHVKNENFASVFHQMFHLLKYKFDTIPIIYHVPGMDEDDLGEEYWKSLLTEPLFNILRRMVGKLTYMGKFHYMSTHVQD